jgi:hypothetical protein
LINFASFVATFASDTPKRSGDCSGLLQHPAERLMQQLAPCISAWARKCVPTLVPSESLMQQRFLQLVQGGV